MYNHSSTIKSDLKSVQSVDKIKNHPKITQKFLHNYPKNRPEFQQNTHFVAIKITLGLQANSCLCILFYIFPLSLAKKQQKWQKTIKFSDFVKNCGRNYSMCFLNTDNIYDLTVSATYNEPNEIYLGISPLYFELKYSLLVCRQNLASVFRSTFCH